MNAPIRTPDTAPRLNSFRDGMNVAVIGAGGGIGAALADQLAGADHVANLWRTYRQPRPGRNAVTLDLEDEGSIAAAAAEIGHAARALDLVIVATGILHDADKLQPEKSWRALTAESLATAYRINTVGPALVAKHFLPLLRRDSKAVFAALSARVGSIADNQLGGWYGYRASKAALNMVLRTLAIELARSRPLACCVGLHPGTVDTALSQPFQKGVPTDRLFPATRAARQLLGVIDDVTPAGSGRVFAWDGTLVPE